MPKAFIKVGNPILWNLRIVYRKKNLFKVLEGKVKNLVLYTK